MWGESDWESALPFLSAFFLGHFHLQNVTFNSILGSTGKERSSYLQMTGSQHVTLSSGTQKLIVYWQHFLEHHPCFQGDSNTSSELSGFKPP